VGRYIIRRLLWSVVVVLLVTLLAFLIFFVLPSTDPTIAFAGKQPTEELKAEVAKNLNLDEPLPVQYLTFVKHIFLGDQYGWPGFGKSYNTRAPIRDELFSRLIVTLQLAIGALVLWLALGISIGVLSALKRRTFSDRAAMGFALIAISMPVFFLGILGLFLFWKTLGIHPGTGYTGFRENPVEFFQRMWLPWLVLALLFAAVYARIVRGSMLDVMGEDYIRTARAKGVSERNVVIRHMLRPAIAPVITLAGIDFALLIGGAVVTESVFNLPGIGAYVLDAVGNNDLPVAMGVTVIAAVFVTVMNLVVDIAYGFLDPRVRYT
jgi:peptide/nickel transport system permease protein